MRTFLGLTAAALLGISLSIPAQASRSQETGDSVQASPQQIALGGPGCSKGKSKGGRGRGHAADPISAV